MKIRKQINGKIAQTTALLACAALMSTSCRREMIHEEELDILVNRQGKFQVETDYPYYSVTYRHGGMSGNLTESLRNRKSWIKEFSVHPGDTLFFEVNAIKSNLPGTHLKADIYVDGELISSKDKTSECETGQCPIEEVPSLQLETIIW